MAEDKKIPIIKDNCPHCKCIQERKITDFKDGVSPKVCSCCKKEYYCIEYQPYPQVFVFTLGLEPSDKSVMVSSIEETEFITED